VNTLALTINSANKIVDTGFNYNAAGNMSADGLPHIQRYHPLSCGQASVSRSCEKAGEGADRGERTQETALIGCYTST